MGRMPRSVAVIVVYDVSIVVFFYDLGCFVEGKVKPLAVSTWLN